MCWMSCLQMNGATLAWPAMLSSAFFRSAVAETPCGETKPLRSVFAPVSCIDGNGIIGEGVLLGDAFHWRPPPGGGAKVQPVKNGANPVVGEGCNGGEGGGGG